MGPADDDGVPRRAASEDLSDALDGAVGDLTVSGDAMRWSPEHAAVPAPGPGLPGLDVVPGRLLGAPPGPAPEWKGELPVGATLVFYTDGLVESRTADLDVGLARLRTVAAGATDDGPADPDELCDRLLAALTGPRRADDVALLALTRLS